MKKIYVLIMIMVIVIVTIATIFFISTSKWEEEVDSTSKWEEEVDIKYLESMQSNPPKDYIQKLTSIIENTSMDPYTRERAVFTLTNIAIKKHETQEIIDFLKEIAMNEKEDNVRTAAYANIDLIREIYPLEKKGSLDLSIAGEIKENSNISLIARISSKVNVEAIVGIDYLHENIEPLSSPRREVNLKENEPKEIKIDMHLKKTGEYTIPVTLMLSFDRIDYEIIEREIYINVYEDGGEVIPYEEQGEN